MPAKDELFSISDLRRPTIRQPSIPTFSRTPRLRSTGQAMTTAFSGMPPGPGISNLATTAWTGRNRPSMYAWCVAPAKTCQKLKNRPDCTMRALAIVSLLFVLALVAVSAYLRLENSGIGCPDWPACYGMIGSPAESTPTVGSTYERLAVEALEPMSWATPVHRLVASVLGLLVLGMALLSVRTRQQRLLSFSAAWPDRVSRLAGYLLVRPAQPGCRHGQSLWWFHDARPARLDGLSRRQAPRQRVASRPAMGRWPPWSFFVSKSVSVA